MRNLTICTIAWVLLALPHAMHAAMFTVDSTDDGVDSAPGDGLCSTAKGGCTLRAAILEANARPGADTIILPAGRYPLQIRGTDEDAGFKGDLDITDDLVIHGAGEVATIIDGNRIDRVFDVHAPANVTLSDLTVTRGEPSAHDIAGGMVNTGAVTLTNVTFLRNRAGRGEFGDGGGLVTFGSATLSQVTFLFNRAGDAFNDVLYEYPSSAGWDGGMLNGGLATLTNVTFRGNRAGDGRSDIDGGEVGGFDNSGEAVLVNVTFRQNRAGDGRLDHQYLGAGNGGSGGGMSNIGTATLTNVIFDGNRAGNGGGLELPPELPESGYGGDGGGMENFGPATLTDVIFVRNRAGQGGLPNGDGGNGGGFYNGDAATLSNATIDRNRAGRGYYYSSGGSGGGIAGGAMTLTNVTITRNRAGDCVGPGRSSDYGEAGSGGGLDGGGYVLTNVTLALNRAGRGMRGAHNGAGHQINGGDTRTIANTIVFGPGESCTEVSSYGTSTGHNLDSGTSCGFTGPGDLSNTDPRLDKRHLVLRLANNGGFTPTMALRPGSPAIDAGDAAACPATDQRGVARPQGAACDIGAYEFQQGDLAAARTVSDASQQ